VLQQVRSAVGTVIYPVRQLVSWPFETGFNLAGYFGDVRRLKEENARLSGLQIRNAAALLRADFLEQENIYLRTLLDMRDRIQLRTQVVNIVRVLDNAYTRRIVMIDSGSRNGIEEGAAVVDTRGLLGQVTSVEPLTSEVTLVNDARQLTAVQVKRTMQQGVLVGAGKMRLLLQYLPTDTDIVVGDILETSNLAGKYPSGIPVATVSSVERSGSVFARIAGKPLADMDNVQSVLVVRMSRQNPPGSPTNNPDNAQK